MARGGDKGELSRMTKGPQRTQSTSTDFPLEAAALAGLAGGDRWARGISSTTGLTDSKGLKDKEMRQGTAYGLVAMFCGWLSQLA